ncbi:MAG: Uncharacterized protein G01um101420_5 [Parcubacteria group bacterium Gr01-1014_20]|nr:MAG: Uncharacterized protein G01um101420_5 [Parcubacteria group bacterium Gr01-1014_20]
MQFQVPQFIETEDKIVGPLSLRQFIYIAVAGALCFILFFALKTWLWFIFTVLLAAISFSLAFLKVNGQPLVRVIMAGARFLWKPQTFVWQPERKTPTRGTDMQPEKPAFSLQDIMAGMALRSTWQKLQTGSRKSPAEEVKPITQKIKERYQIFEKITGERQAARRVDYR